LSTTASSNRDVALAVIKTEGLDETSRARITREARAMGRLGDDSHILPIYDLGGEKGQPYMVLPPPMAAARRVSIDNLASATDTQVRAHGERGAAPP